MPALFEPPHIVNPIRRLLRHTCFYQAEIEAVDAGTSTVVVGYSGRHAHYDSIPLRSPAGGRGRQHRPVDGPGDVRPRPLKTLGDASRCATT